jgi:hypothetical protein
MNSDCYTYIHTTQLTIIDFENFIRFKGKKLLSKPNVLKLVIGFTTVYSRYLFRYIQEPMEEKRRRLLVIYDA